MYIVLCVVCVYGAHDAVGRGLLTPPYTPYTLAIACTPHRWDAASDTLLGVARAALSALSSADKTVALVPPDLEEQTDWQGAVSLAPSLAGDGEYTPEGRPAPGGDEARPVAAAAAAAAAAVMAVGARPVGAKAVGATGAAVRAEKVMEAAAAAAAARGRDRSASPTRRPLAMGAAAAAAASRAEGGGSCVTLHLVKHHTPVKQVSMVSIVSVVSVVSVV